MYSFIQHIQHAVPKNKANIFTVKKNKKTQIYLRTQKIKYSPDRTRNAEDRTRKSDRTHIQKTTKVSKDKPKVCTIVLSKMDPCRNVFSITNQDERSQTIKKQT